MTLIDDIDASLRDSLLKTGKVSIALSGGSSPVALYESLSSIDLEWERVCVTLIDDRLVPADHDDSNQKLVRKTLLQGKASTAEFIRLQDWPESNLPDIAILGMGTDGHFASLFPVMMGDAEAMKRFGNTVVIWDLHSRKPKKILDVPGAPLEIRCAWGSRSNYCFTTTALTSKVWLIYEDEAGEWQAKAVADIGDASKIPLPVDISISADDNHLWINTWNDGLTRLYDISDPFAPTQIMEEQIGEQVNMVSQSWDGERLYYPSSLLASWDKTAASEGNDLQYFKLYKWDGKSLELEFNLDFVELGLGAPHQMRFGAHALYGGMTAQSPSGLMTTPPAH